MEPTLKEIESIYHAALEIESGSERAAFLVRVCGENQTLYNKVKSLLMTHDELGDFLENPLFCPEEIEPDESTLLEGPGTNIGPYKLLEKIGEGGMAIVYMAEQEKPLRRRVALKVIKPGMDTKQVIARFDAERQALALMDHPHIAKVFDAGATQSGRSYFVMELVRGVSITKYCDEHKLSTQKRLELFMLVCHAVHHAHQKGIIHRDLKPSNIMVTMHDGIPTPKVIDFGISKAIDQRLTEHTVFTRYAEMIGTPEYMSPEQTEMSELDIDTRTDIYSLGTVLYELLTGKLPFDAKDLRSAALGEIQRIIREEEPQRPSTHFSGLGKIAEEIAARRSTNAGELAKRLHRELEWIPLKAMRKDRTRRYRSASEFADDIQNYLSDVPLLAGPESTYYRLRKTIQKHRFLFMAVSAVVLTLFVGLCVSTFLYIRMHQALNEVSTLENRAVVYDKLATAERLYAEGQYRAALKEVESASESLDLEPQMQLLHSQILLEMGRFENAEKQLIQLTQATPAIAGAAHSLLARIYVGQDIEKVNEHTRLAESQYPQNAEAFFLRAVTAGTIDEAVEWLSQALDRDPSHYASRKTRAFAYLSLEAYQKMAADVDALIILRTQDYLGYALRAMIQREAGHYAEALKDHTRAINLCSNQKELPQLYNQRKETYMRSGDFKAALQDAEQYAALKFGDPLGRFPVFTVRLAMGDYVSAKTEYEQFPDRPVGQLAAVYASKLIRSGLPLDLPPEIRSLTPFLWMQRVKELYSLLQEQGNPIAKNNEVWLGDWSPDGQQIIYARYRTFNWQAGTLAGINSKTKEVYLGGLETMDLATGKTKLLTSFGMYPVWSPDGKYIAFIHEFNVYLVSAEGGEPRKLVRGYRAHWSKDSKQLYFRARRCGTICSISIDHLEESPEPILDYGGSEFNSFSLSPDESMIAIEKNSEIHVLTFPESQEVRRWKMPWPVQSWTCQLQWHADNKTILADLHAYNNPVGICLFHLDHQEPSHVLNLTRPWCRPKLSPDGSKLLLSHDVSYKVLWLLDLNVSKPLHEVLAPCQSRSEFLSGMLNQWDECIEADKQDPAHYLSRALVYLSLQNYDRAVLDLDQCSMLITDAKETTVLRLQFWSELYFKSKQYDEAELLALQNAQLAERFSEHYRRKHHATRHPFQQLALINANKGVSLDASEWWKKYLDVTADEIIPGSMSFAKNTGTYTLGGGGTDSWNQWGEWDRCQFACKQLQGDGSIVAKIGSFHPVQGDNIQAGVMIRDSLDTGAPHLAVYLKPSGDILIHYRKESYQKKVIHRINANQIGNPQWIKLDRKGNRLRAQGSSDGLNWEDLKTNSFAGSEFKEIEMSDQVYVGLVSTSNQIPKNQDSIPTIEISQVRVTGDVTPVGPFTDSLDIGH